MSSGQGQSQRYIFTLWSSDASIGELTVNGAHSQEEARNAAASYLPECEVFDGQRRCTPVWFDTIKVQEIAGGSRRTNS